MNLRQYWTEVMERAADNLHMISGYPLPRTEDEVKNIVHAALKHGTYGEAAATMIEADEWTIAYLNLRMLDRTGVA